MDVISLGKANKAKKELKKLQDRLGEGVEDIHADVKTRLEELEKQDPGEILNKRVSALESNTASNLNKHNLQVNSLLQYDKFKHTDMVFDDFADASGIDSAKSVDYVHDAAEKKVKIADGKTTAEVVTVAEPVEANYFTLSFAGNMVNQANAVIPLDGGVHENTELVDGKIQLKKQDETSFYKTGSYETSIVDLGDNFKELYKVEGTFTAPEGTEKKVFVASSSDGISFSDYVEVNSDGTIPVSADRYVKVKVELTADGSAAETVVHDFTEAERNAFQENEYVLFDGAAKLQTSYSEQMEADTAFTEAGTVLRSKINKAGFRSIEKVEVVL